MSATTALAQRSVRESLRSPEALLPMLLIPLFFLVVNIGQASKIFPSQSTEFLNGQGYGAFQLPASILLAASFGSAALYLVQEIEGGYFDKLRATPAARTSIIFGRLIAEALKTVVLTIAMVLIAWIFFDISVASGVGGLVLLLILAAGWAVAYSGIMQLIALKTRSAAATNAGSMIFFPLLFLTPNFVPRDLLTRPMEIAASINPVTYLMEAMRSLILEDGYDWASLGKGFAVVVGALLLMIAVSVRMIRRYD